MQTYCPYCMNPSPLDSTCPHCGKDPAAYRPAGHHFPPGKLLQKRYQVGRVLGEGGFGITYLGRDTRLEYRIAIKEYFPAQLVRRETSTSMDVTCHTNIKPGIYEKSRDHFLDEARVMASLQDKNIPEIVRVTDYFEENNTAYIVMELLEGETLETLVNRQGRIAAPDLFRLLEPVLHALEKIHKSGIIHRDISPDNIMVLPEGKLKLMDFGCARDFGDSGTMTVMLKRDYAPVEQYNGHDQGPWTDVYALSATMYHCLTGQAPPSALQRDIKDDLLERPNKLGAALSPKQEEALLKGLARKPEDRWQSISDYYKPLYEEENERIRKEKLRRQREAEAKALEEKKRRQREAKELQKEELRRQREAEAKALEEKKRRQREAKELQKEELRRQREAKKKALKEAGQPTLLEKVQSLPNGAKAAIAAAVCCVLIILSIAAAPGVRSPGEAVISTPEQHLPEPEPKPGQEPDPAPDPIPDPAPVPVQVTAISLSQTSVTMDAGDSVSLKASLAPANAESTVQWSSSNADVASVSSTGDITAHEPGMADITASCDGRSAICQVTVEAVNESDDVPPEPSPVVAAALSLSRDNVSLQVGESASLKAVVTPSNAESTVHWSSSNSSVAAVNSAGKVTAVAAGSARITATCDDCSATCVVTVAAPKKIPATDISLSQYSVSLQVGESASLKAEATPSNASSAVQWSSSDPSVATVNSAGKVTAVAGGTALIMAGCDDCSATCVVTVAAPQKIPATSLSLSQYNASLQVGESTSLRAEVTPSNATSAVQWSSSDSSVATVNSAGKVTAAAAGSALIMASCDDCSSICVVEVS